MQMLELCNEIKGFKQMESTVQLFYWSLSLRTNLMVVAPNPVGI